MANGTSTFGKGPASAAAFTVYSAAQVGALGTSNALVINAPTTQAGALAVSGSATLTGDSTVSAGSGALQTQPESHTANLHLQGPP